MTDTTSLKFTLDFLEWTPWLERAIDTGLSQEDRDQVLATIGDTPNSDYVHVLANDFDAWQARALVHRHVYTSEDPEPTAWRELGATAASRINGCVFCASVHARIFASQSRKRELAQLFLEEGVEAELPPVERAIVDLSTTLTNAPESLSHHDLQPLRGLGFDDPGILDVINYAAFFANANRLMLSLGEPRLQRKSAA